MPASNVRRGNDEGLLLSGLDGSNPLGFLAAVGTLCVLSDAFAGSCRLGWRSVHGSWRPWLAGCGSDERGVCEAVLQTLKNGPTAVFDIGKEIRKENGKDKESSKFPFAHDRFVKELKDRQSEACPSDRRDVDFLAGFGTELYPDAKKGQFQETSLRMVRAGDSNRQGMLFYAKAIREGIGHQHIERTLFRPWDYRDEGYSLRWDPIEDQAYALRWKDPSRSSLADGPGTMLAANSLAVESLRCLPSFVVGRRIHTTGFRYGERRELRFVWPIWTLMVDVEILRSLVALRDLHESPLPRQALLSKGIEEVYSVRRVLQPNQYYSNFAPAQPLA